MSARSRLKAAIRTLFRHERLDTDLHDELVAYVDELTERKVAAGLDRQSARRAARVEAGGIEQVKERVREARSGSGVDTWLKDVAYALRGLRRSPGFTAVAILTLALGVGANTAIFSVVNTVLLQSPPVADLDRLVMVWETDRQTGTTRETASIPDFLDLQVRATAVRPLGGFIPQEVNLNAAGDEPQRLASLVVSRDLLPMLGFRPTIGRFFTEAECRPGGPNVALISDSLWARLYGRGRGALGSTLRLDDKPFTVIGVVPDGADFGVVQVVAAGANAGGFAGRSESVRIDAWVPLQPDPKVMPRETHPLLVIGKLAEKVTLESAQRETEAIGRDLERMYPVNGGRGMHVERLEDVVLGPTRPALILLLGAVALVLLVACVNVANLLLARGAARSHEVAVRSALGAGTKRLVRQFLVETVTLSLIAGAVGVALGQVALKMLVAVAPADIPRLDEVALDARVLGATLALCVLAGLVFGFVPALQARRLDVAAALGASGTRTSAGPRARRQRRALVVAELSLAVVLFCLAALLLTSLGRLTQVDAGFRVGGVLKAEYQLPITRYPVDFKKWPNFAEIHAFNERLLGAARRLPGVVAAAVAGNHPLDRGFTNSFQIVGREAESRTFPEISVRRVSPGYFTTVRLALVRGRVIDERDTTSSLPTLVINEAAARRFFPASNPIGAQVRFWGAARTIVGIVANERSYGLAMPPPIAVYAPLAQAPSVNGAGALLVRTSGDPAALASAIRRVFRDQDPELAVFGIEPLERTMWRSLAARRFVAALLVAFAALALALASVGVHGVLAYSVVQRQREIGIRMALGARRSDVVRSVVLDAVVLAAAGLAIGLGVAFAAAPMLAGQLFGVTPRDPSTYALALIFLAAVALTSSAIPAWRATQVDPVASLRAE